MFRRCDKNSGKETAVSELQNDHVTPAQRVLSLFSAGVCDEHAFIMKGSDFLLRLSVMWLTAPFAAHLTPQGVSFSGE